MLRRNRTEVEVEFKPRGLGKMKAQWLDFAGDLVEPVAMLASGATKAQAAWAGLRGVFMSRVLGPLGLVAGASAGFLLTTRKLVGAWRELGMSASREIERLTVQFKPLLRSMDLARERAKQVFEFGVKTPFEFPDTAEGAKLLEALTRGGLSNQRGMTLVGDAAAVAGVSFAEMAQQVGRLYDGLQSGRPVGMVTMRLQELGVVSGQTRNLIESMQASGASGAEVWRVVERDLGRTAGAMKDMEKTLAALQSQASDTKMQLESGFSENFLEGEKAGVETAIALMEKLTPVARYFGEMFGTVDNALAKGKKRVVDFATGLPGVEAGLKGVGTGLVVMSAAVVTAVAGLVGRFVVGVLSATAASAQLAKASGSVATAQGIELAVGQKLAAAKAQLAAAKVAVANGSKLEALGSVRAAAVHATAAVKTNALAASQMMLRGGLVATGAAARFAGAQLAGMLKAIALNPMFLLTGALLGGATAMLHAANQSRKAREESEAFDRTTRAVTGNLASLRRGVQSTAGLMSAESQAVTELSRAYVALDEARRGGNRQRVGQAEARLAAVRAELEALRAIPRGRLERTEKELERDDLARRSGRAAGEARRGWDAQAGAESEAAEALRLYALRQQEHDQAMADLREEERVLEERRRVMREVADVTAQREALQARLEALEREQADAGQGPRYGMHGGGTAGELGALLSGQVAEVRAALDALDEMEMRASARAVENALASGSEVVALRAKVQAYDDLTAAQSDLAAAEQRLAEASGEERGAAGLDAELRRRRLAMAEGVAARAGVDGGDFSRQGAEVRLRELEELQRMALDAERLEGARQQAVDAELGAVQKRLEHEGQILGLRLRGMEREMALLGVEEQRLEAARERGRVDEESYRQQKELLGARRAAAEREGREQRETLGYGLAVERARRREEEARRQGAGAEAAAARGLADGLSDRMTARRALKEAAEAGMDGAATNDYVQARLAEEREAREALRRREEAERGLARGRDAAGRGLSEAEMGAEVLRRGGRGREARAMLEAARRRMDEATYEEERMRMREMGYEGGEADRLARRNLRITQAERQMEMLRGVSGVTVADSLASIGGGGRAAGTDPNTALLERMTRLLADIRDDNRDDVGMVLK